MAGKEIVGKAFVKALDVQAPLARKNVERLRRVHTDDTPGDMSKRVTRHYLATVTGSGGAAGAAAFVPGGGIPSAAVDTVAFLEFSVLYVLSLAEIHGLHPEDRERRELLVRTVLIGDSAIVALNKGAGRTVPYWAAQIVKKVPMDAVNAANKILGPRFITKYGTQTGVLVLSKQAPVGIGAITGAGANHLIGRGIVRSGKKVFGPPPATWATRDLGNA